MRGEVALSFLLVRVSLDLPAIFQLPSTSLVFNREYFNSNFPLRHLVLLLNQPHTGRLSRL